MLAHIRQFLGDEVGATAIEYGMIAALIVSVVIGTVTLIGPKLKTLFESVVNGW